MEYQKIATLLTQNGEEEFITILFPYLPAKSSTNLPACGFLVLLPKYFLTWTKIIIKFILNVLWRKLICSEKIFYYFGNQNKNTEE